MAYRQHFPENLDNYKIIKNPFKSQITDRHILEKQITQVILDIEEQPKDQHYVHHADEDDHDHARVHRHLCIFSQRHPMIYYPPHFLAAGKILLTGLHTPDSMN